MERYGTLKNGEIEYFKSYKGGLLLNGKIIINPTPEQYAEAEYYKVVNYNDVGTDEVVDNTIRHYVGVKRTLDIAKAERLAQIDAYDTSDAVNSFTYNGQTMWIDKATRVGLVNAVDSAMLLGKEDITFGISGVSVTLPCTTAKAMLAKLELYALECYNVTLAHKNAVDTLTSIEDIDAYDYTTGYPDKLEF